uniref:Uncharacterized protein n=1 Tax=Noctiluca scintillans TaxID=2966 RepID=A0A7S1AGK9_NOCSC|mmetsp:Transcript_45471/g.120621  ORF Transcript_45471/g.120621 Transcript_45471/m.120621 type:complete len:175 (+) Transcript_45471:63-587(+)
MSVTAARSPLNPSWCDSSIDKVMVAARSASVPDHMGSSRSPVSARQVSATITNSSISSPTMRDVWGMRAQKILEGLPSSQSLSVENMVLDPTARGHESFQLLAKNRRKHVRVLSDPQDTCTGPVSIAQEVGWQYRDAEASFTKGPQRHPRVSCPIVQHRDNMLSTNAQLIIRRW